MTFSPFGEVVELFSVGVDTNSGQVQVECNIAYASRSWFQARLQMEFEELFNLGKATRLHSNGRKAVLEKTNQDREQFI